MTIYPALFPHTERSLRNRHLFLADVVLLTAAAYLAFVLRLDRLDLGPYSRTWAFFTLGALLVTPTVFYGLGLYARYWRYASVDDLLLLACGIVAATVIASGISQAGLMVLPGQPAMPRSIVGIFALLALVATVGTRGAVWLLAARHHGGGKGSSRLPVLIVGAGDTAAMIAREIQHCAGDGKQLIGFLDDDPALRGVVIHGAPVLGSLAELALVVRRYAVHQVVIAQPQAAGKLVRRLVRECEQLAVQIKIMPSMAELLNDRLSISQLRNVQIEDLLGRDPVQTDVEAVGRLLRGRRVLITGGGGSIGSELCRQVLRCDPAELVVLGHGENSVFAIQNELQKIAQAEGRTWDCAISVIIADIRFAERVQAVFRRYRPEIVFHAAAHKHVPLMEQNPGEAISNNVVGTRNVLAAAQANAVAHFVMISTDKAVNPTSIMGASKRVAELLVLQAAATTGRPYVAVRFGNVLGSRGSVVLTFHQQIAAGGPITITHPEMRRFFMTIPEAVQLVLQAAVLGQGGEVFTLDMGEPIKIVDLARDMIALSGLQPNRDIDIVFSGMRPGEKLFEELFIPGEAYHPTCHKKILIAANASSFVPLCLDQMVARLALAAHEDDEGMIIALLHTLIPEYSWPATVSAEAGTTPPLLVFPATRESRVAAHS